MMRRDHRKAKKEVYYYQCSITGEAFKATAKAKNEGDLISIAAYYQLHPEYDDRPEHVKKQLAVLAAERTEAGAPDRILGIGEQENTKAKDNADDEEKDEEEEEDEE